MRKTTCAVIGITLLLCTAVWAVPEEDEVNPNPYTKHVTIEGKEVSYKVVGGQIFIALEDLRKAMNLRVDIQEEGRSVAITSQSGVQNQAIASTQQPAGKRIDPAAAKAAVQGVEALVSATESGVSYSDYGKRRADARIALDQFTNEYGDTNPVAMNLSDAMQHFDWARDLWREYTTNQVHRHDFLHTDEPIVANIMRVYPELKQQVEEGNLLYLPTALSAIWSRATKATRAARESLGSL